MFIPLGRDRTYFYQKNINKEKNEGGEHPQQNKGQ
jgi:hypothetical protein